VIRQAVPEDAPRLREVARAAKAHWGYDEELVRTWAAGIEPKGEIEVAEEHGALVAAADRARELGASALGARVVGEHLSEWNRMTPVMRFDL